MLRTIFGGAVLLFVAASLSADIDAEFVPVFCGNLPDSGAWACSYDVVGTISEPWPGNSDDWWSAGLEASLSGGVFYQAPLNDTDPPFPALFGDAPDSEYTTFVTSPGDWPNAPFDGALAQLAWQDETPASLDLGWFDLIDTGLGTFTLARVTVLPDDPANWSADIWLGASTQAGDSTLFEFEWSVPEPATIVLAAFAGLLGLSRRR